MYKQTICRLLEDRLDDGPVRKGTVAMKKLLSFTAILVFLGPTLWGGLAAQRDTERRSVEGLLHDLRHPDAPRRIEAARLLGEHKIVAGVPGLITAAKDPDPEVRYAVAVALRRINDPRALPAFVELTRDPETRIRKVAVDGIVNLYVGEDSGFLTGLKKVVNFLNPLSDDYDPRAVEPFVPVSEDAVNALIDLLFQDDSGLRRDAAQALGILRARKALRAIEDALGRETSDDVKVELIRAVYKIGDPEGGEAVVPFIRDPDKRVHDEAILTAGRLRVKAAVSILNDLYRVGVEERRKIFGFVPVSGADDLQRKVLEALAYIADPSSKDIFEDALDDSRDHYRRFGAEGLGRLGDSSYVELIATKYLREESKSVKLAMSYALFRLGRKEHLVELVDNLGSDQVYYYLLELPPAEVALLFPYLQTEDDSTVIRLLDVIGLRGDAKAVDVVKELTAHSNPDVASATNLALRRLYARFPEGR
ncbi:MAG: hypothetical protein Kow00109_27260 [Acidobacteriota bacterium]